MPGIVVTTWDSDAQPEDRTLMVSQGTPEILGQMLVDMSVDGLTQRGKDPSADKITYAWHYSQATVTDQNSWQVAAEAIIKKDYPNWENVHPDNYYSNQDAEQAKTVGAAVLSAFPDIDLIICNDSTALPGQLAAAEDAGYDAQKITITGFASPQSIKSYCENGTIYNWGLWDCAVQGAMGCYVAAYLAAGNTVKVGDTISIPSIGDVKVEANDSISEGATTGDENNGRRAPARAPCLHQGQHERLQLLSCIDLRRGCRENGAPASGSARGRYPRGTFACEPEALAAPGWGAARRFDRPYAGYLQTPSPLQASSPGVGETRGKEPDTWLIWMASRSLTTTTSTSRLPTTRASTSRAPTASTGA